MLETTRGIHRASPRDRSPSVDCVAHAQRFSFRTKYSQMNLYSILLLSSLLSIVLPAPVYPNSPDSYTGSYEERRMRRRIESIRSKLKGNTASSSSRIVSTASFRTPTVYAQKPASKTYGFDANKESEAVKYSSDPFEFGMPHIDWTSLTPPQNNHNYKTYKDVVTPHGSHSSDYSSLADSLTDSPR